MKQNQRESTCSAACLGKGFALFATVSFVASFTLTGCGSSLGVDSGAGGPGDEPGGPFALLEANNGFGQLLPHELFKIAADGMISSEIISVLDHDDLIDHLRPDNLLHAMPQFSTQAQLPSGAAGNHYFALRFNRPPHIGSTFNMSGATIVDGGLSGNISFLLRDPATGSSAPLKGRAFLGGQTLVRKGSSVLLERWVQSAGSTHSGAVEIDGEHPGLGFPGTESPYGGAGELVDPNVLVFVADIDGDLSTHDTFPTGVHLQVHIHKGIKDEDGQNLEHAALASTTVGADVFKPEILISAPPLAHPEIEPSMGERDVDPLVRPLVRFSEPVQPLSVGMLAGLGSADVSSAIRLKFGPTASQAHMPFTVRPISVFDLSEYELIPAYHFPGQGPPDQTCEAYNRIDVEVFAGQILDLAEDANQNLQAVDSHFFTGSGPGIVNTPVAPDTIYVACGGAQPSVRVVDLHGWGLGTGNHMYDPTFLTFEKGQTWAPFNPNVRLMGGTLWPHLQPGVCTINGGSAGTFTLALDSNLREELITNPLVLSTGDMMLGHALDTSFNNSAPPGGCQSGGFNLCASDGIKEIDLMVVGNTMQPSIITLLTSPNLLVGGENPISLAPSPNPPPLRFPPLCTSPYIGGQQVSSIDNIILQGLYNLLAPGDYLGDPANGVPPSGKLTKEQNEWFVGPSPVGTDLPSCTNYQLRQQIGHFLYIVDRLRGEVVVFNSNRMVVIDRIELPDPTSFAMSPNLDFLAVTSQLASVVHFIDIDPFSATFHQVRQTTTVNAGPRGIAWDPGNEDILVCCEGADTVDIISAHSLEVRKSVISSLDGPFEVAITPRQAAHGYMRNVYFAYILNRNGRVALFESGPSGVNGWGYDDILGVAPQVFARPKAIQPDHIDLRSAVWIAHEGAIDPISGVAAPAGTGALSKLVISSAIPGMITINSGLITPGFRDMALTVPVSLGEEQLSGIPVDIAFDNQRNKGALPNPVTGYSAGAPIPINGKNLIRNQAPMPAVNTNTPNYVFCAIPHSSGGDGVIDVLDLDAGTLRTDTDAWIAGVQSIPAPQVTVLMDYWRQ